jgi:DNA-binding MarR family transcriptional regulator
VAGTVGTAVDDYGVDLFGSFACSSDGQSQPNLREKMQKTTRASAVPAFLDLFYPIHYMVGIKIEDTLRSGLLSRQQTCILWMIRMQGVNGKVMRRKEIERALTGWFEISSSAISKALRLLSKPPLGFVTIVEDSESAREKVVTLTPEGEEFLQQMIRNGKVLMQWMIDRLTDEEVSTGVHFLAKVSQVFEEFPGVEELLGAKAVIPALPAREAKARPAQRERKKASSR